jgi:hypothetical protein
VYVICSSDDENELYSQVTDLIKEGYEPCGGVFIERLVESKMSRSGRRDTVETTTMFHQSLWFRPKLKSG